MTRVKDDKPARPPASRRARPPRNDRDVGAALRAAYKRTVEESVPQEMLDLLGKLN